MRKVFGSGMMAMAMMGMSDVTSQERYHEPSQGKERSGFEGGTMLNYSAGNKPIFMQNNSQKAKSKRLIASNKGQGRK